MLVSLAVVLCAGSKLVLSVASCINCLKCDQLAVSRGLLFGFKIGYISTLLMQLPLFLNFQ